MWGAFRDLVLHCYLSLQPFSAVACRLLWCLRCRRISSSTGCIVMIIGTPVGIVRWNRGYTILMQSVRGWYTVIRVYIVYVWPGPERDQFRLLQVLSTMNTDKWTLTVIICLRGRKWPRKMNATVNRMKWYWGLKLLAEKEEKWLRAEEERLNNKLHSETGCRRRKNFRYNNLSEDP